MWFQSPQYLRWSRLLLLRKENTDAILRDVVIPAGSRVLDVGCGSGELIRALSRQVSARFTGVDIDSGLIDYALQHRSDGEEYLCADAAALPFADDTFDVVLSHTFFTNMFDAEAAMREMQRVCKKGSIIASITTDCMFFVPHSGGVYPPYPWAEEFTALRTRLDNAYHRLGQQCLNGVAPENMPRFFAASGLGDVHVQALSKFSSLSNEDAAFRARYLELELEAEKTRASLLPETLQQRYLSLLEQRKQDLSTPENQIWDWSGGTHLLIRGVNTKHMLTCAPAPGDSCRSLAEAGFPKLSKQCIRSHVEGVSTVTLTDEETGARFSGTGATPEMASREAYRAAAGAWLKRHADSDYPRSRKSPRELLSGNSLTAQTLLRLNPRLADAGEDALLQELQQWGSDLPVSEFTSLLTGASHCLPDCLLDWCYGISLYTGTSSEDALVNAMYHFCETYALKRLVREQLTPPLLNIDWTRHPRAHSWRSTLQGQGYSLRFVDASLGEGIPAVGALLTGNGKARLAVRAGYSLKDALEKCLLALLSRRTADALLSHRCVIRNTPPTATDIFNLLQTGEGSLPASLFGATPGWVSFCREDWTGDTPSDFSRLRSLFRLRGWDVCFRDFSREGVYACQVIVPGAGLYCDFGQERLLEYRLSQLAQPVLRNPAAASPDALELAMKYVRLKQNWLGENTWAFLSGTGKEATVFGAVADGDILTGLYLLSRNQLREAAACFPPRAKEFLCLKDFAAHGSWEVSRALFSEDVLRNVQQLLQNPWGALSF